MTGTRRCGRLVMPPVRLVMLPVWLVMVLVVAVLAGGCTGGTPGGAVTSTLAIDAPDAEVALFVSAWQAAQPAEIAALTSDPTAAGAQIGAVVRGLAPTGISVSTGAITQPGPDSAAVSASFVWTMPRGITWKYQTSWGLQRSGSSWLVTWKPSLIHPQLAVGQSVALRTTPASGGTIVDSTNQPLVGPVTVHAVVALPAKITNVAATAAALTAALGAIDPTVTVASVTDGLRRADPKTGYTVTNLRDADYTSVSARLATITGLTIPQSVRELPATKDFAKVLLSEVEPLAVKAAAGTPGWQIVVVDASGGDLSTLAGQDAVAGTNVMLTLDSSVQKAAEASLAGIPEPAVLVAIQPSTGGILAVAQNAPANALGPIALTGRYPPGSTFKIVTATAGFDAGVVTPTSSVDCPGQVTINGQSIHNEGFELGTVPLTTAFAKSCNTTFARLASTLPDDALPLAAAEYGIGRDFVVQGITTLTGSVPAATTVEQRAENGFGQGVVLLTPFAAALMAATVAHGTLPLPVLVKGGTPTTIDRPAGARSPAVQTGLRTLMRAVVTDGTATLLAADGEVYAKTGTADYTDSAGQDHAHAWTVGYRGDVAFAALIVGGDTSKRTNGVVDTFLKALPG